MNPCNKTILSIHPLFALESCHHCLGDALVSCDDEICHSVEESVIRQRTVPRALSPYMQVMGLPVTQVPTIQVMNPPVSQALTRPQMRYQPSNNPQRAVSSISLRFSMKSCGHHCRGGVMSCPNDEAHSVRDNVSKRGTVPKALSPHIQVAYLPVVCSSKMAVFIDIPHSY